GFAAELGQYLARLRSAPADDVEHGAALGLELADEGARLFELGAPALTPPLGQLRDEGRVLALDLGEHAALLDERGTLVLEAPPADLELADRGRELARRGLAARLRRVDDRGREAQPARHREPEALADRAVDEPVAWREAHGVDVDGDELDARLVQCVELHRRIVGRRADQYVRHDQAIDQ